MSKRYDASWFNELENNVKDELFDQNDDLDFFNKVVNENDENDPK